MLLEYPEVFNGTVDWEIVRHEVENAQKIEDLKNEMLKLLTQHQYKTLIESAEKAREKNFLNTELREISNLMEIYGLEKTNIRPIHSEWFEYTDWLQIKEYYNWVRFVVLRIEYGYEDERIAEIKELIKNGRVSRDAIRKISAVSLKDTYKVYEQLLKEEWEEPLVSVIIPVHNAEDVIENTLDSVLNQSYQNMEVIIVDDASTDSSREKIEAYEDSRLKKIFLETNHHVCYSGNIGFENATGKYIALIGHDDCWRADKLEKQISFLEEHPSYGLTFTWVNIIDENGENKNVENDIFYKTFRNYNFKKEYWNRRLIVKGNSFCAPSACIRSDILKRTGIYRYALVQLQDYDLWLRILRETEVYTIQEKLTYYRRFTQAGKNVSDMNEKAKARDYHEKQWIQETYVKNLSSEEFTQIFNDDMKNKNVCDEKEILCEKAFFLWNMGNCFAEKWFIELLEDMECQKILEEKYNFKLTDFYEMNTEPMLFDQTIVGIVKQQQLIIRNYANEE